MRSLINLRGICDNVVNFIRSPVTEMVCAFIIEMSKYYIFAFIFQFTGNQLIYPLLQFSILMVPWIMLGHGALRHMASRNTVNVYSDLNDYDSSNIQKPKKNVYLLGFLFATFFIIEFLPL
jgi:hypothetical protein